MATGLSHTVLPTAMLIKGRSCLQSFSVREDHPPSPSAAKKMKVTSLYGKIGGFRLNYGRGSQKGRPLERKSRETKRTPPNVCIVTVFAALHTFWQKFTAVLSGNPLPGDEPFQASQRPSVWVLLVHLIPLAAVFVITSLNLYGYWIGKELSGGNNQNTPKELALQLTAKAHELLIMASLSEILLTHLLKSLACGFGLPFGSLTAGSKFKDLSYLWSRDFRAMWAASYPRKSLLLPLLLLCLILSIVAGPSSATALIPKLTEWPSGHALMTLNTTDAILWPSRLQESATQPDRCDHSTLGCFNSLTWDSIGPTLFSYWGHDTLGGMSAMPHQVNIPGVSSLRSMDVRLRYPGSSSPQYTLATVQHAAIGDMVNTFRFLTFPSRSRKCRKRWAEAMCSYQDAKWYLKTMQPLVFSACMQTQLNTTKVAFPSLQAQTLVLTTRYLALNATFGNDDENDDNHPQFRWVPSSTSTNQLLPDKSLDVAVKLPETMSGTSSESRVFACTIQAQWAKSTTFTSFSNTDNLVSSVVFGLGSLMFNSKYSNGHPVSITPDWAQRTVDSRLDSQPNVTAFERFMQLGQPHENPEAKLELVLSVLFAEMMAHTSPGTAPLSISSNDLDLKMRGDLTVQSDREARTSAEVETVTMLPDAKDYVTKFTLSTSMTGYGYGLVTVSGVSWSTVISMVVLYVYSAVVLIHLVSLYVSRDIYIKSWREDREMLLTCLWSRSTPEVRAEGQEHGMTQKNHDGEPNILKEMVILTSRRRQPELSFRTNDYLRVNY
ncbi:hypothetical protein PV08_02548 [Exophiala spinifera]|uniref:Uncharacterized protein n=1 Tax=Exophiala spinifera TaxID=91928 RepID=A0A0D2BHZ3_9EURO|nr:uncharacterized protein PV08_02548 [Exophiala spinifera]KIW18260.1 hypothetical protein PV08_02548 [Exophiala spinifera]